MSYKSESRTNSINGVTAAIAGLTILPRLATFRAMWWAPRISTRTATGGLRTSTATFGIHEWIRAGLRIMQDIGRGSILGDGLGSMMLLGVTRRFTTAAGH